MKYINKVVVSGIALALATASCADLDTKYEGGLVSADQKRVALQNKAELNQEQLEQTAGGVGVVPDEQEGKKQEAPHSSLSAKPRFI